MHRCAALDERLVHVHGTYYKLHYIGFRVCSASGHAWVLMTEHSCTNVLHRICG